MSTATRANYSRLDRILHKAAFSGIEIQKSLADIEDRMHAGSLRGIAAAAPIFITSLPRAGTTLLLDVVAKLPGFATHTYRSMPFVLCPILWDSISRGFRRQDAMQERAHGDGMSVGYDSPEAFEEVIWRSFWPRKYREDGIALWSAADRDAEFESFFRSHMKKLIALRLGAGAAEPGLGRYVSKNNANVARLPLIRALFPDAVILVPFRDPVDQAGSLLRQHKRFLEIHREDPFARWYMDAIGHFEFGADLRLIDFPGDTEATRDPMQADFWLAYWMRAFRYLISSPAEGVRFVDFDRLCAEPLPVLEALGGALGSPGASELLMQQAASFHPAVHYDPAGLALNPALVEEARSLQDVLRRRAI